MGGHHLGAAKDEPTAIALVHEALDGGITFFDNCWEYHRGKSENWMGKGLKGRRDKVFLMTKVCTHGRDGSLATADARTILEPPANRSSGSVASSRRLLRKRSGTFHAPGRRRRSHAQRAKSMAKFASSDFTGHKDPGMHLAMLDTGFPFDAVQMPLNPFDATFRSFETQVLPELNRRGIAALGMKPMSGHGEPIKTARSPPKKLLRYAMSLPVTVTITGMEKPEILRQNLRIAQNFTPMSAAEMQALRERVQTGRRRRPLRAVQSVDQIR